MPLEVGNIAITRACSVPGTRLAHRIARNAAAGTIEGVCPEKRIGRSKWFNERTETAKDIHGSRTAPQRSLGSITARIKKLAPETDREAPKERGSRTLRPHAFRHLAVTELLESGAPEQTVIALAGGLGGKWSKPTHTPGFRLRRTR
jgi:hypothetical protein